MTDYYNTTNAVGVDLVNLQIKAKGQQKIVLELFGYFPKMSGSMAHRKYQIVTGKGKTPITSIRRALSDLASKGLIVQTNEKIIGNYGVNEYFYQKV